MPPSSRPARGSAGALDMARAEKIAAAMAASRPGIDHLDAVIFLDVDGVLHPFRTRAQIQFVPRCLDALKQALRSSNAKLVLSSAWRTDPQGRSEVAARLNMHGIPTFVSWTRQLPGHPEEQRPKEILEWVERHSPASWVALDDWPLHAHEKRMSGHFVQTDPRQGLTSDAAARLEKLMAAQRESTRRAPADEDESGGWASAAAAMPGSKESTALIHSLPTIR